MNFIIRFFNRPVQQTARDVLFVLLLVSLLLSTSVTPLHATEVSSDMPVMLEGVSAMLIDTQRGQVLFSKNEHEPLRIGIASKLMTILLALENAKEGALVTASSEAINTPGAQLSLRVGEKYSVEALSYAVLLAGANDAAIALSESVGSSTMEFVTMMNARAEKLGMQNTRFENPTGTTEDNQYTTASDMALMIRYALQNPQFSRIFTTQAKPWYDDRKTTLLTNRNAMFWSYDGTDGGVTGGHDPSLESIITTATRNNLRLIAIVLDVPSTSKNTDCTNLLNYGFSNFRYGSLVSAGQTLRTVTVDNQPLNLLARSDAYYVYPVGQTFVEGLETNVDESKLIPPILKNISVGKAIFLLADKTVIEVELIPERDIVPQKTRLQTLLERLNKNREVLYLIILLVIVEVLWMLIRLTKWLSRKRLSPSRHSTRLH